MIERFPDGAVRWCPPRNLQARVGATHIKPGSGYWRGPAWRSEHFITHALPVYADLIAWVETQDWWCYVPWPDERQMFSVWFAHAIGERHYDNPLIADLYLFHDLLHAYTFIDAPGDTTQRWRTRMRANEIMVSLETEALIYTRCPQLRAHSFEQVLWADPWLAAGGLPGNAADFGIELDDQELDLLGAASVWPLLTPPRWQGLWWARRRASRAPNPDCPHEQAIALYEHRASRDYAAWGDTWREVERYRQEELLRF